MGNATVSRSLFRGEHRFSSCPGAISAGRMGDAVRLEEYVSQFSAVPPSRHDDERILHVFDIRRTMSEEYESLDEFGSAGRERRRRPKRKTYEELQRLLEEAILKNKRMSKRVARAEHEARRRRGPDRPPNRAE